MTRRQPRLELIKSIIDRNKYDGAPLLDMLRDAGITRGKFRAMCIEHGLKTKGMEDRNG